MPADQAWRINTEADDMKWMRWAWRNREFKFVAGENGRNPEKNLPRLRFVHYETHIEWPRHELETLAVRGERLTACAMEPPVFMLLSDINTGSTILNETLYYIVWNNLRFFLNNVQ